MVEEEEQTKRNTAESTKKETTRTRKKLTRAAQIYHYGQIEDNNVPSSFSLVAVTFVVVMNTPCSRTVYICILYMAFTTPDS